MLANGASKAPEWLYKDMQYEIAIINDIEVCKAMGWTFTELDAQPFFSVEVLRKWLATVEDAKAIVRKKAEQKAKSGGRGMRRRRRGRRR